jgi:hypothetical protein
MPEIMPILGTDSESITIKLTLISLFSMPLSPLTIDHNSSCKIKLLFDCLRIQHHGRTFTRLFVLLNAAPSRPEIDRFLNNLT